MNSDLLRAHLITRPVIFHVGTLEPHRKGHFHADSLEGHCLSVSIHPEAWVEIARLGGEPVWRLDHEEGQFVDVLSLESDPVAAQAIRAWGVAQGLAQEKTCWRAWQYDSEEDEWRYLLFETEDEAQLDADEFETRTGGNIEPVSVCVGTPALCEIIGWRDTGTNDVLDFLVMAYIEAHAPDIQGVWWDETLDPDALSAPRGGILPSRLHQWAPSKSSLEDALAWLETSEWDNQAPDFSRSSSQSCRP